MAAPLTFAGVDLGLFRDTAGVCIGQWDGEGRAHVAGWEFTPDGGKVDLLAVKEKLLWVRDTLNLAEVTYDPRYLEVEAQEWARDDALPMVEFPQHPARMVPACQQAYELIAGRRVVHGGEPVLERHVLAAVRRPARNGWTLEKAGVSGGAVEPIDLCIALVLVLHRMSVYQEEEKVRPPNLW